MMPVVIAGNAIWRLSVRRMLSGETINNKGSRRAPIWHDEVEVARELARVQNRVRGANRSSWPISGSDRVNFGGRETVLAALFHDKSREIVPARLATSRKMIDLAHAALGRLSPTPGHLEQSVRQVGRRSWTANLVFDNGENIPLRGCGHYRLDEILAETAVKPRGADDHMSRIGGAHALFSRELAHPIDAERTWLCVFDIWSFSSAIEYIVGRDLDYGGSDAGRCSRDLRRTFGVDRHGKIRLILRQVDSRKSGGVDYDVRSNGLDCIGCAAPHGEIESRSSYRHDFYVTL